MKTRRHLAAVFVLMIAATCLQTRAGFAQGPQGPQQDMTIDAAMRAAVIESAIKNLNEAYVFPEVAGKMQQALRERLANKEYDSVTSARGFAEKLTADLQAVSHDKHLRVGYSYEPIPERKNAEEPSAEEIERFKTFMRQTNFGFEKIERLQGNIGYLDLRGFNPAQFAAETGAAAMTFLANTDALIIDLRRNGGGDPAMVAFLTSYLFGAEPVHLNDLYFRPDDSTRQWWTLPHVPGNRFGDKKEVYVLTSRRTFSAAEEFTYNLKNLKRATIVGETTGGGAHPGGGRRLNEHFQMFVPTGRAINPISKTNWEGTGVEPDVKVPADQALKVATVAALGKLIEKETNAQRKAQLQGGLEAAQKELDEMKKGAKPTP
ncbi:MAG TPA: S41 family peptidase [Blastocatellia bacterium]|nr:S41 family peptidase [Blastocatellia bacterium]